VGQLTCPRRSPQLLTHGHKAGYCDAHLANGDVLAAAHEARVQHVVPQGGDDCRGLASGKGAAQGEAPPVGLTLVVCHADHGDHLLLRWHWY
jgi:hypothetical protein